MKIANNILELIGKTPLVRLNALNDTHAEIVLKLESYNPTGSVKDRVALAMVEDAEKRGLINKDSILIEPTSGNTGIGLALVASVKGYKLILAMPDTMSIERRKFILSLGAKIVLTDGSKGMKGAVAKAEELHKQTPNSIILNQFENFSNSEYHSRTTAKEIWEDTDGLVDIIVAGVGTGGTISGIAHKLKPLNSKIKMIAVEPKESPVLSGGSAGPHKIQGIGAGFIPKIYDETMIDEVITVDVEEASQTARELARKEGIHSGFSAGAALYGALKVAKRHESKGKRIIVIIPDTGTRYLSTFLYE